MSTYVKIPTTTHRIPAYETGFQRDILKIYTLDVAYLQARAAMKHAGLGLMKDPQPEPQGEDGELEAATNGEGVDTAGTPTLVDDASLEGKCQSGECILFNQKTELLAGVIGLQIVGYEVARQYGLQMPLRPEHVIVDYSVEPPGTCRVLWTNSNSPFTNPSGPSGYVWLENQEEMWVMAQASQEETDALGITGTNKPAGSVHILSFAPRIANRKVTPAGYPISIIRRIRQRGNIPLSVTVNGMDLEGLTRKLGKGKLPGSLVYWGVVRAANAVGSIWNHNGKEDSVPQAAGIVAMALQNTFAQRPVREV